MKYKAIIYLICVDDGIVICKEKEGLLTIPYFELNGDYDSSEEIKEDFKSKTRLVIKKNDFQYLARVNEEVVLYSAVIDLNFKTNYETIRSALAGAKAISFMLLKMLHKQT